MKQIVKIVMLVVFINSGITPLLVKGQDHIINNKDQIQMENNEKLMMQTNQELAEDNNLVFYVQFHLNPEAVSPFKKSLLELIEKMTKEETFVSAFFHQDSQDPTRFTIYERWNEPSMDAFSKNQLKGKSYRDDYEAHIEEWSATPRDISVLKPLQRWVNPKLRPSSKDLAFCVNFHIKPDKVEEWKQGALHVLNSMSGEKTFVSAFLHQDSNDPTRFTLYERWNEPSMDAFVKNQLTAKDYREEYEKQLAQWSQSERSFKVLDPMGSWYKRSNKPLIRGIKKSEHIGITVPDLAQAVKFFETFLGGKTIGEASNFQSDDDWLKDQLAVHPRSVIKKIQHVQLFDDLIIELFEYESPGQDTFYPKNSDFGGHHWAFEVEDIEQAITSLKENDIEVLGVYTYNDPTWPNISGSFKNIRWVYFQTPWGMSMELIEKN
jgi:quinol monooxygenase YgiN/catechol 2,3-dioxygenase-like lactoylglutathione lyase family enzyme